MNVIFRADASLHIGTGHIMRCLALAGELERLGAHCHFVCREHSGNLFWLVAEHGYSLDTLEPACLAETGTVSQSIEDPSHSDWLATTWAVDAHQLVTIIGDQPADWLIVDHYALDVRWERVVRSVCKHIMVIDDLADRQHHCDLLLDQNLGRRPEDYATLVPDDCKVVVGPELALLRPEFSALRAGSMARRTSLEITRLLINMGGVDRSNATGMVLEALAQSSLPQECKITVLMGADAPWLRRVQQTADGMRWSTNVIVNSRNVAKLMAESDLAIGGGGIATLERCCLGLPTLTMTLAENQVRGTMALEKAGAIICLGGDRDLATELGVKLSHVTQPDVLSAMQRACFSITDGLGVNRVASMLMNASD